MDATELRQLLRAGETLTVEFKAGSINDSELVEAVACLANGSGGYLLIGVDDDGRATGAKPRHGDHTDPSRIEALIANKTEPAVLATATVESFGRRRCSRCRCSRLWDRRGNQRREVCAPGDQREG